MKNKPILLIWVIIAALFVVDYFSEHEYLQKISDLNIQKVLYILLFCVVAYTLGSVYLLKGQSSKQFFSLLKTDEDYKKQVLKRAIILLVVIGIAFYILINQVEGV